MKTGTDIVTDRNGAENKCVEHSGGLLKCEEIQQVLFDYLAHELSESQSVLVREHIRRCSKCRDEAAEIEQTLSFLHKGDNARGDMRLSDERRKRILLAVFHPVLNWIYLHHILVSLLLALAVLLGVILGLRNFAIFKHPDLSDSVRVLIRPFAGDKPPPPSAENTHRQ